VEGQPPPSGRARRASGSAAGKKGEGSGVRCKPHCGRRASRRNAAAHLHGGAR
jgi:hypothetical protein